MKYLKLVAKLTDATVAVNDALALLQILSNSSLVLNKVSNQDSKCSFLNISIKSKFLRLGVISQIVDALNDFRNAIVDSINDQTLAEANAVEEYQERLAQLDFEFAEFQRQINAVNVDLTATNNKIDQVTEFLNQRVADLKQYKAELQLENDIYADETQIYDDTKNEFIREQEITEQALALVQSVDFSHIQV